MIISIVSGVLVFIFLCLGVKIIRPTHRGVVETLGRFNRIAEPGFHWVIPFIEIIRYRNITERIADVQPQDIITKDNLNARVDLQVYYQVINNPDAIKASYYNIDDFKNQIVALAQTTARNVIGDMKFIEVNSQRNELNKKLAVIIEAQIKDWGVKVVRVELKEITPPKSVQETMNAVIQAQNQKDAAIDTATALETQADGQRRAAIKKAEGDKDANVLRAEGVRLATIKEAEGQAEAIKLVNEAAEKYFVGNAQEMKRLETLERGLSTNTKYVFSTDIIDLIKKIGGSQK